EALVDKALARRVEHEAQRVARLGVLVSDLAIAFVDGRVGVPRDRVAARVVSRQLCPDCLRHGVTVARVVLAASDVREVPARSEQGRPQRWRSLEASAGQDDASARSESLKLAIFEDFDACDGARRLVVDEPDCGAAVVNLDASLGRDFIVQPKQLYPLA